MGWMEIGAYAAISVWIGSILAICIFCRERSETVLNKRRRRNEDTVDTIFSDITDPAKFYLIENVYHDDSGGMDSSFDWQDVSPMGDDMSTSLMDD